MTHPVNLPEQGFIRDYVECFEPATEAPRQYHVAMALSLLAMAVGPKVWIQLAGQMKLNLYVLILGPSTEVRKSTAINFGENLLRSAADKHPELFKAEWLPPSGTVSAEALVRRLAATERALLVFDEYGRLLSGSKTKSYMADVKELLTEVFRCWSPGRLTQAAPIEAGPCFPCLIAATTRSRFEEEITAEDVASGFLGRHLIVYAQSTDKVLPWPPAPEESKRDDLIEQLAEVARSVKGEITFSDAAKAAISEWYCTRRSGLAGEEDAELALPVFFRLDGTVRKLAALFEIASNPRAPVVISDQSARQAIAYADFVLGEIRRRLLDGVLGELATKLRKLHDAIERKPGITKSALMKVTNLAPEECTTLTELLFAEGQIRIERNVGRNRMGVAFWPEEAPGE